MEHEYVNSNLDPSLIVAFQYLSLKSGVSHEIINHIIRFFRRTKLIWTSDPDPPVVPLASRCFFVMTIAPSLRADCICALRDVFSKTPHGNYLLDQIKRGELIMPYINPTVSVYVYNYVLARWERNALNLFVSSSEYMSPIINSSTADTITKIITTIFACSSMRENRRLYIIQRTTEKVTSTRLIDVRACGQIYIQANAMVSDLTQTDCPVIIVTLHQFLPSDNIKGMDYFAYVSVVLPRDTNSILCVAVDVGETCVLSRFPPLLFGCQKQRVAYIDTEASAIASFVLKGRKCWPAVIFAQYIVATRKRTLDTLFRSIKRWEVVHALPYPSFRFYMWYVFYTVQSVLVTDMRTYLKARAIENKLKYKTPQDVVIGLSGSPCFIDNVVKLDLSSGSIKSMITKPQYSYVSPSSHELGVRQVRTLDDKTH